MSSDFKTWWADYGSGLIRHTNHDHEQHAERVAAHAWEHRDYREAMLRGEIATLKIENANLRAEITALKAERDPLAEMWAALAEYQPMADRNGHGKSWKRMCEERTEAAASSAGSASRPAGEAWEAASWAASAASWTAMNEAGDAARAAARSIDAIRRAKEAQR